MQSDDFVDIRALLDRSSAMKKIREHLRQGDLTGPWLEVAGEAVSKASRPRRYRGGKLFVDVYAAPLLQELATFRKQKLLRALKEREEFSGIIDIVFRHGQRPS